MGITQTGTGGQYGKTVRISPVNKCHAAVGDSSRRCRHCTKVRLHDLRHSCASFLLASGASPRVVVEILGHSGIPITMNTYAHVLSTLLGGAVDGMDDVLG